MPFILNENKPRNQHLHTEFRGIRLLLYYCFDLHAVPELEHYPSIMVHRRIIHQAVEQLHIKLQR